jgi:RNA polymerase subunit RPABC4/transcription elongation factor Spt4
VRYYQKNGTTSSATAQAACYACPTTTTTTTTIAPTTTTTTVAVEWYDLLLCSNLTTHKTSEQYTTGTFVINERVETVSPIDTYRIVGIYTTNPGGVKDLIVPTGFTGCPTTTTTTTCNPTPNWVNNGAVFCSACVSYQPQIDTNPCSPTYNTTRNFSLGAGAPCDYTANWVNNGAAFCSACVSYQPQIDNNPCSATYNTTRNFNLGASAPCNYSPNFVNTGTTCVGFDLYNVQTDNNPCSPTYNQTQLGSLIQANSPSCGYTTTTTTAAPVFSYYVATRCDNPLSQQYFQTTGSYAIGEAVRYNGYCWEIQALTGTSGVTPDFNYINCSACYVANPTTTTTTTTASPSCTCFTIVNEGGATGNYTYVDCSTGQTLSVNISAGDTQNRCVVLGNTPTQNSGLLTIIDCTTPCSIEGNCTGC